MAVTLHEELEEFLLLIRFFVRWGRGQVSILIEIGFTLLTALLGSDFSSQAEVSIHQINVRKALFQDAFGN